MGRVADATVPAPRRSDDAIAVAMARSSNNGAPRAAWSGPCHRNPPTCKVMPLMFVAQGGCAVDPASLLLVVALLRLVVVPCLNAHKRPVRDPLYSFNSLQHRPRKRPPTRSREPQDETRSRSARAHQPPAPEGGQPVK